MMIQITPFFLSPAFLLYGYNSSGQTITQLKDSSQLTVKVIDVADMTKLMDYTLTIANMYDTLIVKTRSTQNQYFNLDSSITHTVTVSKTGYKTINTTCKYPNDSAYVEIEFFMPRENLTKKETKRAHMNTRKLKEWNQGSLGGLKKIKPEKKTYFITRTRVLSSSHTSTSYESIK